MMKWCPSLNLNHKGINSSYWFWFPINMAPFGPILFQILPIGQLPASVRLWKSWPLLLFGRMEIIFYRLLAIFSNPAPRMSAHWCLYPQLTGFHQSRCLNQLFKITRIATNNSIDNWQLCLSNSLLTLHDHLSPPTMALVLELTRINFFSSNALGSIALASLSWSFHWLTWACLLSIKRAS